MTGAFPFGYSGATSVYLFLYLVTWVAHWILAASVVGGAFIAAGALRTGRDQLANDLGGALPLLLGLAITAGVAPLLFVQILYRHAFYSANLLLYVRFLAILPALLGCFYLFYFVRSKRAAGLRGRTRAAILAVAGVLALFVAFSWTELHTLSLAPTTWISRYAAGEHTNLSAAVVWRWALFACLAAPITAAVAAAISKFHGRGDDAAAPLAAVAFIGSGLSVVCAVLYWTELPQQATSALSSGGALVHLVGLGAFTGLSIGLWGLAAARKRVSARLRGLVFAATVAQLWCLAVVREALRAQALDLSSLATAHLQSFGQGGKLAFVGFALINAAAIAWCARVAWSVWRDAQSD